MELEFLGTGAGVPSKGRNTSSVVLRMPEHGGRLWMFDCGEGTQHQLFRSSLKLSQLDKVFITHLHGDHTFGLPGLLSSRSFQGGTDPLTIYGPKGIRYLVETALNVTGTHLPYDLDFVEIADGTVIEEKAFTIAVAELDHGIPSFGYRLVEREIPGKLQVARLQALGLPPGPLYRQIKRGETVQAPDGKMIDGREFLDPPRRGRIITILGDTRPCDAAVTLARQAHVLVHEATYGESESHLASQYFHSTAAQAAKMAVKAHVSKLILTHISPRYHKDAQRLLEEAKQIFSCTSLARDFWSCDIPRTRR